jgi:LacI family transcriptional regulator
MAKRSKSKTRLPTMNDVAKLAGVSQTTVSFVVNNTPNTGIPEETRQRILAAIEELGYRPNAFAKSLRLRRSQIIGLVTDSILTSPYAGKIIQGAQDAAKAAGKILLFANTGGDPELEKADIDTMLEHQVDGLIYATMSHHEITLLDSLSETLCVLLNCYDKDRLLPCVTPDEVKSALSATKILLQKGHRRIGFVNCIENVPASVGRLEGYKQALEVYDVPFDEELVCYGTSDQDSAYECTKQLMQLSSPATAIFCFNDQMAMGVYQALCDLNLNIPDDVAVMGFDNLEIIAAYLRPKLSTIELPHYDMGQWAVNFLVEHLEKEEWPKPIQHTIECRYIERSSV